MRYFEVDTDYAVLVADRPRRFAQIIRQTAGGPDSRPRMPLQTVLSVQYVTTNLVGKRIEPTWIGRYRQADPPYRRHRPTGKLVDVLQAARDAGIIPDRVLRMLTGPTQIARELTA